MTDTSILFACIVSNPLGGRIFVEAGDKGKLDRQISGFVSAVVNKRPDPQGSFAQGPVSFSYLKSPQGTYSFVAVAPSSLEVDVIWSFLLDLSSQADGQDDKVKLTAVLTQLLEEYKHITKKEQIKPKTNSSGVAKKNSSRTALYSSTWKVIQTFFSSVAEKTTLRNPDVDPVTNFFRAVGESYDEQGGTESLVKSFQVVSDATKQQIQKIEADISQQGISTFVKETLDKAERNALELGGTIMDGAAKIDLEAQQSGGYQEYIKKELIVVEEAIVPLANQVGNAFIEGIPQAGGLIMDSFEKIGKDVEEKGGFENYVKVESENALAASIQVGTVLANSATVFSQDVQTKGFSVALTEGWASLTKAFAKPKVATSGSGFDEESF